MKLALFGGTFDPVHSGHVEAAVAAANANSLDRVLIVPSGVPPHKSRECRADYEHRYRMVELACMADARLAPSRLEEPRADGAPHYSIETIAKAQRSLTFEPPLRFVIGVDAFNEMNLWRAAEEVAATVEFLVVGRPGYEVPADRTPFPVSSTFVPCTHPASSRVVRHRVKIGGSLADLAPPAVCEYIWEHDLYRH